MRAHHGSISHSKRAEIEEGLKRGDIRGIVATSSLELGIDMGTVELVLLVESPGSVARGLQRVGRAGHGVNEVSVGRIYPKFRGDLLESAVVAERMRSADIDAIAVPRNVLDVLSQQIVALCCNRPHTVDEIAALVRRCWSYRELSRDALEAVLDMLSGRYPSADFADLKPLLSWDRAADRLSPRRGAALVTRMNAGTIPDRGAFGVHLGEGGPRVGELDEEMVYETRAGDNITLGASTWRVEAISPAIELPPRRKRLGGPRAAYAARSRFSRMMRGCRAAMRRSARAGPSGRRRPCSQLRNVCTLIPSASANRT